MADDDNSNRHDKPNLQLPAARDYSVGYGKPPVEKRFKSGQSGNPRGRPKGVKRSPVPSLAEERIKTLITEEAYRTISINERGRRLDIPVITAILRTLAMNAIKGNNRAAHLFSTLLSKTEADNRKLASEAFASMLDYKDIWTKELQRRERLGLKLPGPIPHPDDIIINAKKMEFRIAGPMTKDELPRYKLGAELLEAFEEANSEIALKLDSMPEGPERHRLECSLAMQTELVDNLRQHYGPRSERTKDPMIRDVERLLGVPFDVDEEDEKEGESVA